MNIDEQAVTVGRPSNNQGSITFRGASELKCVGFTIVKNLPRSRKAAIQSDYISR